VKNGAPRTRRLRTKLLGLTLSTVVSLAMVEVGARLLTVEPAQIRGKPLGANAFSESLAYPIPGERAPTAPYRMDPQTGFCLMSDYDGPIEFGEAPGGHYRLRTNHVGLRDDRPLVPKKEGTLRVLVVGDSMTFGHGVERDDAFPAVLERELVSKLGRPVEVVNAGVLCWGQREEVGFLEHRAEELQPDFVVLQFTVANDVLDNLRYLPGSAELVPDRTLGEDLATQWLFRLPLAEWSRAYRLVMWHIGRHVIRYRAMMEPKRLERTRALIARARDAAKKLHARFGVVIAPTIVQADRTFAEVLLRTHRINDAIAASCQQDGIPVLDPLPALRQAHKEGRESYFGKDMHWNGEGHRIVGRELATWIVPLLHD
jgi:lysophospholipase L1-like esterase